MPNISERRNMKISKYLTLLAVTILPPLTGFSQTANPPTAQPASAPATLPSSADEAVRLAQSGVDDQVVLAFIGQSRSYYNLSGADITAPKNGGVSSQVLTAMLNHDSAPRVQEQSSSPVAATAVAPQPTVTQSATVSATPITNQLAFQKPDLDTNGAVTLDEWQRFDTNAGPKENFSALDVNGDAQINATEFLTQTPKHAKRYHFFADLEKTNKDYSSRGQEEFQQPGWQLFSIRF
jgi:hypothetical protein